MSEEVRDIFDKGFQRCLTELEDCAQLVNKYLSNEDKENAQVKLLELVQQYGETKFNFEKNCDHLMSTRAHFAEEEENDKPAGSEEVETYFRNLQETDGATYNSQSDPHYKKISKLFKAKRISFMDKSIVEVQETRSQKKSLLFTQLGDDDSVLESQEFSVPLDPLTKQPISNPCRNCVCHHVYEHDVIMEYIASEQKRNKKKKKMCKCPYVGCSNANLKVQDIVKDRELRTQIENANANDSD